MKFVTPLFVLLIAAATPSLADMKAAVSAPWDGKKVPAGQHTIEFEFNPKKYNIGKMITLVCSLIILAGLFWLLYQSFQPSLNNDPEVVERQPKVVEKKAPVKKTVSKKKKKKK